MTQRSSQDALQNSWMKIEESTLSKTHTKGYKSECMHKCPEAFLEAKSSLEVSQRHHQVLTKISNQKTKC